MPLAQLSKLEHGQLRLQASGHLFQTVNSQAVSHAQPVLVMAAMKTAMGNPAARRFAVIRLAVGGKATRLSDEAERRKSRQPIKPLTRSRHQAQFALQRTDDHIGSLFTVLDQWWHTGPGSLFCLNECTCSRARAQQ